MALKFKFKSKDEVPAEDYFPSGFLFLAVLAPGPETPENEVRQKRVQLFLEHFVCVSWRGSSGAMGEYARVVPNCGAALRWFRKNCAISFPP
jgi:hypothetical protein